MCWSEQGYYAMLWAVLNQMENWNNQIKNKEIKNKMKYISGHYTYLKYK